MNGIQHIWEGDKTHHRGWDGNDDNCIEWWMRDLSTNLKTHHSHWIITASIPLHPFPHPYIVSYKILHIQPVIVFTFPTMSVLWNWWELSEWPSCGEMMFLCHFLLSSSLSISLNFNHLTFGGDPVHNSLARMDSGSWESEWTKWDNLTIARYLTETNGE